MGIGDWGFAIILFHIISFFIFYLKQYKNLKIKINNIIFAIKNFGLLINNQKNKENDKKENKIIKFKKNLKNLISKDNKNNKNNIKNSKNISSILLKNNKIKKVHNINNNNNKNNNLFKNNLYHINNLHNNKNKKNLLNKLKNIKKNNTIKLQKQNNLLKNNLRKTTKNSTNERTKFNNQKIIQRIKNIMKFTIEEKNLLPYDLALKYDKRKYCTYYISLLKTKHCFIFSFIQSNDYNSKIIKIDFFFIQFAINYIINALFFDDDTMHKIYEARGSFNLEYQLPKIIYSSFISFIINKIFSFLAISNDSVLDLKKIKRKRMLI